MKSLRIVSSAVLLTASYLGAQSPADMLVRLRALQLKEAAGPVPLIYSPASEERALRWQRSLAAARAWYQAQLHLEAPITLAVLDRETWKKATTASLPHAVVKSGLILFPEHIEDIYPDAPKSLDPVLGAEAVSFHEAGHIFADALKLDGNTFVSEFVANVFMAGYIRAARPDLTFMLNGPFPGMKTPRYTSGGDLNYLEANIPPENSFWLELQLQRLAAIEREVDNTPLVDYLTDGGRERINRIHFSRDGDGLFHISQLQGEVDMRALVDFNHNSFQHSAFEGR